GRNPGADWRAGRSVGFRKEAAVAGKARLHGPDGRADVTLRLDQGRGKRPRPVWKNGPVTIQNTAGERREASVPSHGAQRSPSHGEHRLKVRRSALRSLSRMGEGERD